MIEQLIALDKTIFAAINGSHSPFFDWLMYVISHKYTWIPLYVYFIYFIFKHTKKKLLTLVVALAIVALADVCASQLAKPTFKRLRPCHDTTLTQVHTVNNICGKKYGFFSSHASNTAALGTFFFLLIYNIKRTRTAYLLVVWALVSGYSRVYLGVHFPLDVLSGFMCGTALGWGAYYFVSKKIKAI